VKPHSHTLPRWHWPSSRTSAQTEQRPTSERPDATPPMTHLPPCPRCTGAAGDDKSCRPRPLISSAALSGQTCVHLALRGHRVPRWLNGKGACRGTAWGALPQSWDPHTPPQHGRGAAEARGSGTSGLSPAPALRKVHRISGG